MDCYLKLLYMIKLVNVKVFIVNEYLLMMRLMNGKYDIGGLKVVLIVY